MSCSALCRFWHAVVLGCGVSTLAGVAQAQFIEHRADRPTLDKWMYPFGPPGGRESNAPVFGAILISGFDDRDAQFVLGFATGSSVPAGLGEDSYRVARGSVRATVSTDRVFFYDPTWDSFRGLLPDTDPRYVPDEDPGRPVELFACGFRNGFSATTFVESSPFGGTPMIPPAEGARNVFAAVYDEQGLATDVSRQVRLGFEAVPAAIGLTDAVAPGQLVPVDTTLTFTLDLCDPAFNAYLRRALDEGVLFLMITSLEPASGGPGGGTGGAYPTFYTKENPVAIPLGYAATLELDVQVYRGGDVDGDGVVDFNDFLAYLNLYNAGTLAADLTGDCTVDFNDMLDFLNRFNR